MMREKIMIRKMMTKKIGGLLLVAVLCGGMTIPVFAAETPEDISVEETTDEKPEADNSVSDPVMEDITDDLVPIDELENNVPSASDEMSESDLDTIDLENQATTDDTSLEQPLPEEDVDAENAALETTIATTPQDPLYASPVGWKTIGGKVYYYLDSKTYYKNGIWTIDGKEYGFDKEGCLVYGVFKFGGKLYYANETTGVLNEKKNTWLTWNGKQYYANGNGNLYYSRVVPAGSSTKYYLGKSGTIATGVVKTNAGFVFADPNNSGKIQAKAGWITWNGKKYYSDANGYLYANQVISFGSDTRYYVGSDAAVATGVIKTSSGYVYADPNNGGKIQIKSGWITWNGKKYFCNGNGYLYANQLISFGSDTMYYMGANATIVYGGIIKYGGKFYRSNSSNGLLTLIKSGWIKYEGHSYYANSDGSLVTSQWVKLGDRWYHFNSASYCDKEQSSPPLDAMGQKAQGYSSSTGYLILVDRDAHRVSIYSGSIWNWRQVKTFSCGNGKASTPTITGEFSIPSKYPRSQPYFDSGSARCWYPTRIYGGYLFHSVLYYPASGPYSIMDGRLGVGVSHGCVRLALENAKWIYDNIPIGTKVVIY